MGEIIITTPEQLRTLIEEAVRSTLHPSQIKQTKEPPDTITLAATDERFMMPKDFEPEAYFANCYGIDHGDHPERVVLKMTARQAKFARALPLHHSQKEEEKGEEYSLFSYYLCPHAYDFKQALLSFMAEIEVLVPASLRCEMQSIINDMATKYQSK